MTVLLALLAAQAMAAGPPAAPVAPASAPASAPVAQGETAGPPAPPKPKPKLSVALTPAGCRTDIPTEPGVITVCAPPPQGYRIDPDVIRAKKLAHNHTLPKGRELLRDTSCKVVGPGGCMNPPMINVLAAAATAVNMVKTALDGGNVGQLFITDPQPSEYQIYLAAKADREAAEREQAAQAAAVAAKATRGQAVP